MQPEEKAIVPEAEPKVSVVINLISGMSFLAKDIPASSYAQLLLCLRDSAIVDITINDQWFNKSAIASVYIDQTPVPLPEQTQSCCA